MLTLSDLRDSANHVIHRSDHTVGDGTVLHGWIPAEARWISVDVHEPAVPARGATVVLAVPPGRERITLIRSAVHISRALAADGWRVVRFDWSGTGQSPLVDETIAAEHWTGDLRAVQQWALRDGEVHGVALTLGAAVMTAAEDDGWASRVLLAPVSGKQWVRHQSALRRLGGPGMPAQVKPGTELLDLQLSTEGAATLKALPEPQDDPARHIRILTAEETGELPVNVHPRDAEVPEGLTSAVAAALDSHAPARTQDNPQRLIPQDTIVIPVHGTDVRVRATESGHQHRPAILTEPLDPAPDAPGVGFVSAGSEAMEASGGLWMRTALLASARGAVCLMAERSDANELVWSDKAYDTNPYARHTLTECRELVCHLGELTTGPLSAAGICLGAWGLLAMADKLPDSVSSRLSIYAVNMVTWQSSAWRYWRMGLRTGPLARTLPELADDPHPSLSGLNSDGEGGSSSKLRALAKMPMALAADLGRTVVRAARSYSVNGSPRVTSLAGALGVIDVPEPMIRRLERVPGLHVDLIFGSEDLELSNVSEGSYGPSTTITHLKQLDHPVLATMARRTLLDYLLDQLPTTEQPTD